MSVFTELPVYPQERPNVLVRIFVKMRVWINLWITRGEIKRAAEQVIKDVQARRNAQR